MNGYTRSASKVFFSLFAPYSVYGGRFIKKRTCSPRSKFFSVIITYFLKGSKQEAKLNKLFPFVKIAANMEVYHLVPLVQRKPRHLSGLSAGLLI